MSLLRAFRCVVASSLRAGPRYYHVGQGDGHCQGCIERAREDSRPCFFSEQVPELDRDALGPWTRRSVTAQLDAYLDRSDPEVLQAELNRISAAESASVLHLHPRKSRQQLWSDRQERLRNVRTARFFTVSCKALQDTSSPATTATRLSSRERDALDPAHGVSSLSASLLYLPDHPLSGAATAAPARVDHAEQDVLKTVLGILRPSTDSSWCTPGMVLGSDGVSCCSPGAMWKDTGGGGWRGLDVVHPLLDPDLFPAWDPFCRDKRLAGAPYLLQAFHSLHCTGAAAWHLFYYHPHSLQNRWLITVLPDKGLWTSILERYREFLDSEQEPAGETQRDKLLGEALLTRLRFELVQ